ncbi:MAG TPA: hypothetical protein VHO50_07285 [Bacteroidales bacterium]|nr:hypothetical protein [Bacteroidales bacterium]
MKNFLLTLSLLMVTAVLSYGQESDKEVSACLTASGSDVKYLKDFRVQLGKSAEEELRFKANISLWKDMTYRFTMCTSDGSKGTLILSVKNDASQQVVSSFDQKTGKTYASVDFTCKKSGIYQLSYDFINEKQGSGIGLISVLK